VKRHELLRHLAEHGCRLYREGSRHALFWNPLNGRTTTVPRHTEILNNLALKICKDLGIPKP
jgi:predicted RNA binding protein YcfA (HicA-like mRNA interferase family)